MTVGPLDEDYQTIQKAIDQASWGDIIEVHSGNYTENIRVTKAVTLMGVDTGNGLPVVIASGSGSVVTLMANGTTINGFRLTGSGGCCVDAGIQIQSCNNSVINNIIVNNKYGVYIKPGYKNNTLIANDFLENKEAVGGQSGKWGDGCLTVGSWQKHKNAENIRSIKGNYYSDYDEPKEGCYDMNIDGICDLPRRAGSFYSAYNGTY